MTVTDIGSLVNLLLLLVIGSSFLTWGRLLYLHRKRPAGLLPSLVPQERRERPFWTPADALVMFGLQIFFLAAAGMITGGLNSTLASDPSAAKPTANFATLALVDMIVKVVAGLATLAWLQWSAQDAIGKLGFSLNAARIQFGLKAAYLLLPPVLAISAAVSSQVAYEHPVLNLLSELSSPATIAVVFVATAIVTPVFEEFLFRVLMQGGLERMVDPQPADDRPWEPRSWMPIVVTSLVFASLHLGQGAAPIPLFFLSLGLGYLYRRTGNISASIVVHMVLNGLTLAVELTKSMTPAS